MERSLLALLAAHLPLVTRVLEEDGHSATSILNTDVLHPVDAYNLVKRLARSWPRVKEELEREEGVGEEALGKVALAMEGFPSWEGSRVAAALGLLNIQLYYDLEPGELGAGRLVEPSTGRLFQVGRPHRGG